MTEQPDDGEHLAPVIPLFGEHPDPAWAVPGLDSTAPESSEPTKAARRASNVSLAGLSRRNHSRWEVEHLLRSRDLDEETIASEVERLESVGLIDDANLASTLVRVEHERKGRGRQAIVAELRRRHIPQHTIDEAIAELDSDDERQRAVDLAATRARQLSSLDHATAVRRLTGFLQRRGYPSGIVSEVVRETLGRESRGPNGAGGVRFR